MRKIFIKFLFFLLLYFIGGMTIGCKLFGDGYFMTFKLNHIDGYSYNADSEKNIMELKKNGTTVSINFDQEGNDKNHSINIMMKTLHKYNFLYINKIIIIVNDNEVLFNIKKKYNLHPEKIEITRNNENLNYYAYYISKEKLNITKIIKKYMGKENPVLVKVIVSFSLDNGSEKIIECLYNATLYNRPKSPSDFMYKLFPGM